MIFERILILGCGLIGSSLAASARECGLAKEIVGVDNKYELMREEILSLTKYLDHLRVLKKQTFVLSQFRLKEFLLL